MAPHNSSIKNIEDLKGSQIGIAGGSIDKSWILIRAYTMKVHGYDLSQHIEPAYAAPPLINGMAQKEHGHRWQVIEKQPSNLSNAALQRGQCSVKMLSII
jgi:ABC-type nitrate/sulfonate/bicarbonate transport system substrate-binding protein